MSGVQAVGIQLGMQCRKSRSQCHCTECSQCGEKNTNCGPAPTTVIRFGTLPCPYRVSSLHPFRGSHRTQDCNCMHGKDVATSVQDQRYTAWYDRDRDNTDDGTSGGENSAIDHILVSEKLWGLVSEVDIIHEAPAGVQGEVLSDHWPVIVTFGAPGQVARAGSDAGSDELSLSAAQHAAGEAAWIWAACSALVTTSALLMVS